MIRSVRSGTTTHREAAPEMARPWMSHVLIAAAIYNLVWGAWVVLRPGDLFEAIGLPLPTYPQLWQCIGMIVGVYGVGYAIAAADPLRHWPIVLVGLLGKVFGPMGFIGAVVQGQLPWAFGWVIVTNDLVWWWPFSVILIAAARYHRKTDRMESVMTATPSSSAVTRALQSARTQHGDDLLCLSQDNRLLVVLLRHSGCTFCREAAADLADARPAIDEAGAKLVIVHMGDDEQGAAFLERYGLGDVWRVSDPDQQLYRALGLRRMKWWEMFRPSVWRRGYDVCVVQRHGVGRPVGDGLQMPGVFVIESGRVIRSYEHRTAADRPDYPDLAHGIDDAPGESANASAQPGRSGMS
jgi:peroxiredoxin